ncbi:MAG: translation initiation factor IF-2 [Spirochaetota bacterium]
MKVHELAKTKDLSTEEVLKILGSLGIKNKKSASALNQEELEQFQEYVDKNMNSQPDVALIKRKPKESEEDHKKIVIKKKRVIIVKKPHREGKKEEPSDKEAVQEKEKEEPEKKPAKKQKREEEHKPEEKKPVYKLKEKKLKKKEPKEVAPAKKHPRGKKKYEYRKEREEAEEKLDKLFQHKKKEKSAPASRVPKRIEIMESITVGDLARKMNLKANELISKLMSLGVMARINDQIDAETASLVASEYGTSTKVVSLYDETVIKEEDDRPEDLKPRPPVVTVMGHVDHGKTKLLDAIRNTNVVDTEIGGITQHIGAYKASMGEKEIVFLDTPGHEAFTMMRARGAKVTDIVVLVVAADDGVMPQTVEAIDHAKEANVPMVVAVNKVDLSGANPGKVKNELAERGVVPEEWGGDTLMVEVSALKKTGLDELMETVLLQADMLDLKANPHKKASGVVIESKVDTGRGIVATVLINNGTLKAGDPFVAGVYPGKVRAMFDERGKNIEKALPSHPVEIIGFSGLPVAGDPFQVTENEREAKQVGEKRQELKRYEESKNVKKVTLENLYDQIKEGEVLELKAIIKADVQGSVEAIKDSLEKLSTSQVRLNPIHTGVGAINETDIILASASNAIVIGFRVRPNNKASALAKKEKVDIRRYSIIYDVIEDIRSAMEGLLEPELQEEIVGTAEVRQVFKVPKIGNVAGCYVNSGRIPRNAKVRVIREGIEVYSGGISSLKRYKEDEKEVAAGYECGIKIDNFDDIKEGDTLEAFIIHEIKQTLNSKV